MATEEVSDEHGGSKNEATKRILHLLRLLSANDCTRKDIFEHLAEHYRVGTSEGTESATSRRANKMFERDIALLEEVGYEIKRERTDTQTIRYSLVKGSGQGTTFLFSETEIDALALIHTLFADPTKYTQADPNQPLPAQPPRNPFAEEVLALIERLVATLPNAQRKHFDRWVRKPYVYFNLTTVADYFPHRSTIDEIVRAISWRQQIRFEYQSKQLKQSPVTHENVDPYYITYLDGHFYLIGFIHKMNQFFEYRIDRIIGSSLKIQPNMIDGARRRRPITFHYWIDGSLARSGLSKRWLTQTIEREEVYLDEKRQQRSRVLIRATAYSEWRILQQLHKYGDKAELVDPPHLRERMRQEVTRIHSFYEK